MPRKATGTSFQDRSGRWYARVTLGPGRRIGPRSRCRRASTRPPPTRGKRCSPASPLACAPGRCLATLRRGCSNAPRAPKARVSGMCSPQRIESSPVTCRSRVAWGRMRRFARSAKRGRQASLRACTPTTCQPRAHPTTTPVRSRAMSTPSRATFRPSRSPSTTRKRCSVHCRAISKSPRADASGRRSPGSSRSQPSAPHHRREPPSSRVASAVRRGQGEGLPVPRRRSGVPRRAHGAARLACDRGLPAPRGATLARGRSVHVVGCRPRPRSDHVGREQDERPPHVDARSQRRARLGHVEGVPRTDRWKARGSPRRARLRQQHRAALHPLADGSSQAPHVPAPRRHRARAVAREDEDTAPHPRP